MPSSMKSVDALLQVAVVAAAPIAHVGEAELLAVAAAAARVAAQDGDASFAECGGRVVIGCGRVLGLEDRGGAAVDMKEERQRAVLCHIVAARMVEQALNLEAIRRLPLHMLNSERQSVRIVAVRSCGFDCVNGSRAGKRRRVDGVSLVEVFQHDGQVALSVQVAGGSKFAGFADDDGGGRGPQAGNRSRYRVRFG